MPLTNPLYTIIVMVLRGALNGNIMIFRIPITLKATKFSYTTLYIDCTIICYETPLGTAHSTRFKIALLCFISDETIYQNLS